MDSIVEIIKSALASTEYKKSSQSWYLEFNDVLHIISLQKSQYGNQFYINFGVYLDTYEVKTKVKSNWCHIHFRLDEGSRVSEALDMDSQMDFDERKELISASLFKGVEQLKLFNSKGAIAAELKNEKYNFMRVLPGTWELLGKS